MEALRTKITRGRGSNGLWIGNGITSSAAAADPSLMALVAIIDDTNNSGSETRSGANHHPGKWRSTANRIADGDVLVKYTYYGDALLTGSVTAADYLQIDNGFQKQSGRLVQWRF